MLQPELSLEVRYAQLNRFCAQMCRKNEHLLKQLEIKKSQLATLLSNISDRDEELVRLADFINNALEGSLN